MAMLALALAVASADRTVCHVLPTRIEITLPAHIDPSISQLGVFRLSTPNAFWFLLNDLAHEVKWRNGQRSLTLPRTQSGVRFIAGKGHRQMIFSRSGDYRITFADQLETEYAEMVSSSCRIRIGR